MFPMGDIEMIMSSNVRLVKRRTGIVTKRAGFLFKKSLILLAKREKSAAQEDARRY
jgi:hypothetical protein